MTREEFVKTIKTHVLDIAVSDTIQDLEDPPGRVPNESQVAAHEWHSGLDQTSKAFVEHVVGMAAESAKFGVLAVLDRVRAVDGDTGELVLEYRKRGQSVRLNGFDQELLHDLLARWFDARSRWEKPPLDLHHVPKCSVAMKLVRGYTPEKGRASRCQHASTRILQRRIPLWPILLKRSLVRIFRISGTSPKCLNLR